MSFIKSDIKSKTPVNLYYEDLGEGTPLVFIHGWPLSLEMWEYQTSVLAREGFRCISYDRRGFGQSSKPATGYDYDTLADDLKAVLDGLDLQNAVLVGFSMGGGEIARYFARYGGQRVAKVVLVSAVTPSMLKTPENPDGVDKSVFDEMMKGIKEDRIGFLEEFGKDFFGVSMMHHPLSNALMHYYLTLESKASPIGTQDCAKAFAETDFTQDMGKINVPTLIIHGDADKTVPIETGGQRAAKMVRDSLFIVYEGAPHGLFYTHKDRLNNDLREFILSAPRIVEMKQPAERQTMATAQF